MIAPMLRAPALTIRTSVGAAAPQGGLGPLVVPGAAALCVYLLLLATPQMLTDGDTYWHIAAGQWMLDHRQIVRADPFSHTFAGEPWVAHEWLAELAMALAYRAGGWSGVIALTASAAAATAAIMAAWLGRWLPPARLAAVLTVGLSLLAFNMLARPHILVLPVVAAWAAGLLSARADGRAPSVWLLPLMLLWANLHGSFVLGLALIAPFALEALIEQRQRPWPVVRDWGGFGLAALVTATVTPHGLHGLIFPFQLMGLAAVEHIGEWSSPDFSVFQPLEIALLCALGLGLSGRVRLPIVRIVLLLALTHLTLQHARHQLVLGVLGAMIIGQALASGPQPAQSGRLAPLWLAAIALAAVAATWARLAIEVRRGDELMTPASALLSVPADLKAQPVFNEYGWGGYLIFQGVRPFIDGRADMYGDALLTEYLKASRGEADEVETVFGRHGVAWTILRPNRVLVRTLDSSPGWRRLYADDHAVVHVRATRMPPLRGPSH